MQKQALVALVALSLVGVSSSARAVTPKPPAVMTDGDAAFDKLVDDYYAEYPTAHPVAATALGLHDKDAELDDVSEGGVLRELERILAWRNRFAAVDKKHLSAAKATDLEIVLQAIES